jgi:hypothetical protein
MGRSDGAGAATGHRQQFRTARLHELHERLGVHGERSIPFAQQHGEKNKCCLSSAMFTRPQVAVSSSSLAVEFRITTIGWFAEMLPRSGPHAVQGCRRFLLILRHSMDRSQRHFLCPRSTVARLAVSNVGRSLGSVILRNRRSERNFVSVASDEMVLDSVRVSVVAQCCAQPTRGALVM